MVDAIFIEPEANRRFHVAYLDLVGYAARVRTYTELQRDVRRDRQLPERGRDSLGRRAGRVRGRRRGRGGDGAAGARGRAVPPVAAGRRLARQHARYRDVCKRAALQLLGERLEADGGSGFATPHRARTSAAALTMSRRLRASDAAMGARPLASTPYDSMNAAEYLLASGADGKVAIESWDARITYGELREAVAQRGGRLARARARAGGARARLRAGLDRLGDRLPGSDLGRRGRRRPQLAAVRARARGRSSDESERALRLVRSGVGPTARADPGADLASARADHERRSSRAASRARRRCRPSERSGRRTRRSGSTRRGRPACRRP